MRTNGNQESYLDRGGNPTIRELLQKLVFNPVDGSIKLNDRRLILQRSSFGSQLREELIRSCGREEAFAIMTRLGFKAGMEDAAFIRKTWPSLDLGDAFTAGTRLHTLRGMVRVEAVHNDFDFKRSKFSGEFLWHDSAEAVEHCERCGRGQETVCWSQVGYAAGYATFFFEKPIVYKEIQCIACGDKACRVVGKPIDAWDDEELVRIYRMRVLPDEPVRVRPVIRPAAEVGLRRDPQASFASLLVAPLSSRLEQVARANIPLLITGEAGTGKRSAARWLHDATCRSDAGFVRLHCADVKDDTLDRLLTRRNRTVGRGRRAGDDVGTLVLDDIERLSESAQLRLSEIVETGGQMAGAQERPRLIALSALSPQALAASPAFRRDLLFRLSALPFAMPALRERRQDIPALAGEMLRVAAARQGMAAPEITAGALAFLASMDFPGNLPELEALLLGALLSAEPGRPVDIPVLRMLVPDRQPPVRAERKKAPLDTDLEEAILNGNISLDEVNNRIYQTTIRLANGNVSRAARMLGLSRAQFAYRLGQAGEKGGKLGVYTMIET